MSVLPTYEEMEEKRQQMITSFKDIAAAMTRCISVIDEYTKYSPATVTGPTETLLPEGQVPVPASASKKAVRAPSKKKVKDPNAPKRPPSAYILFQNDVRAKLREDNPDAAYKEILPIIAQKWKVLPAAEKHIYEEAYQEANKDFRAREEAYKGAAPAPDATPAPVASAISSDSSSDEEVHGVVAEEDSSENSSDESSSTPAQPKTPPAKSKKAPTAPATISPQTLNAAVAATKDVKKEKKEKKRKNDGEAAVAAATTPDTKKKAKKAKKTQE